MKKTNIKILAVLLSLLAFITCLTGCDIEDYFGDIGDYFSDDNSGNNDNDGNNDNKETDAPVYGFASVEGIPDYSGKPYVKLNGGVPEFSESEKVTKSYEFYSDLDSLGRCRYTIACVGKDIMPTEDRESISSVKPSGWINKKYDTDLVDGGYLYNRCHLIGFQLTGENANEKNLITGTRYLNIDGMLPFENMVADYVKETGNHVMYRVTPIFVGNNLLASGVKIEGWSVEDNGEGICFNVFAYNVQPGITIDYATGDNALSGEEISTKAPEEDEKTDKEDAKEKSYILNTGTKKIHRPDCSSVDDIKPENKEEYSGSIDELIAKGYTACKSCDPE